nr:hypothetical protein [Gemmatimonadales bacterium]
MNLPFWLAVDAPQVFGALRLGHDGLERLARFRLGALLRVAVQAGFHADRFRAVGIRNLAAESALDPLGVLGSLPSSTKQELREAGRAALVGGRVGDGWRSSTSSGSTGEPFRVYYDARAWATLKYLVKLRARAACGAHVGERVA